LIQATTTGLRNLNRKEFLKQLIPLPPSLNKQQGIANKLKEKMAEVEEFRSGTKKQREAINALPQSILKKAFGGKL
jgi:restriction endonuclease S subunit